MLDLSRYVGRWIEIARLPNWFERGAFATADYALTTDGIQVVNTSFDKQGTALVSIIGLARQIGPMTLEVSFPGSPWAEYKVEWVSEDYGLAIVGNSARSSLWILSRSRISRAALGALLSLARRFGYSVDSVQINDSTLVENW